MFALTHDVMTRVAGRSHFDVTAHDVVLFGFRGALPILRDDLVAGTSKDLEVQQTDHVHPRCTLGVWDRNAKTVACFCGSTVPSLKFVEKAAAIGGTGTNQLLTGLLQYAMGKHSPPSGQSHDAFVQLGLFPHQRTGDDAIYEETDAIYAGAIGDNIHAGYCDPAGTFTSSQGCQVVCGTPRLAAPHDRADSGQWPAFRDLAYSSKQTKFLYLLVPGAEVREAATAPAGALPARIRFGSAGAPVDALKKALREAGFSDLDESDVFGPATTLAVASYQRYRMLSVDGVCGLNTAQALRLKKWPKH